MIIPTVADSGGAVVGSDPSATPPAYQARGTKRCRSTRAEVEERRDRLCQIIAEMRPMTVRQVFYQATVRGIVEKSEAGYAKVQTDLTLLRRAKILPYHWLTDHTRWQRKPRSFNGIEQALGETARLYRKALWFDANSYVEVWLEKEALAGVVLPVTETYDVPLMCAKGYPSLSFLHGAAEHIASLGVPTNIYHLGDFDPSGVNAGEKIEETLSEMAPEANINFQRIAVTSDQIALWKLPTRPTKLSDSRARNFGSEVSVELDAIEPAVLRSLVEGAINKHLPREKLQVLLLAEASERAMLEAFAADVGRGRP